VKALIRMRAGAVFVLAGLLVILGVGLNPDAKSGVRKVSVAVRSDHADAFAALGTGGKSTFTVDGVPLIVDEETVIYS
jgi:hypothetical protein